MSCFQNTILLQVSENIYWCQYFSVCCQCIFQEVFKKKDDSWLHPRLTDLLYKIQEYLVLTSFLYYFTLKFLSSHTLDFILLYLFSFWNVFGIKYKIGIYLFNMFLQDFKTIYWIIHLFPISWNVNFLICKILGFVFSTHSNPFDLLIPTPVLHDFNYFGF